MVINIIYNSDRDWENEAHPFCIMPEHPSQNVRPLKEPYLGIGELMLRNWIDLERNNYFLKQKNHLR
jgi:hypothetical protein